MQAFKLARKDESIMIVGLILAAGEGTRMGQPKATLEIDGVRLIDRAVAVFKAAGLEKIFVVLGAWVGEVDGATVIDNKEWSRGMASSLHAGLTYISDVAEIESVVISLVDLPGLTSEAIKVIAGTKRDLVVATYNDVIGHPMKFARSRVSKEILIRLKPASTNGCASFANAKPFVVIESLGGLEIPLIRATISTISGRSSGSPPVKRISLMPCETAASITAMSSSVVNKS